MARKPKKDRGEETSEADVSPPADGVTEIIDDSGGELVNQTPHTERAPERKPPPDVKVDRYRVVNGGRILHRGALTIMKAGKELDARAFDLDKLREQGIQLELVKD